MVYSYMVYRRFSYIVLYRLLFIVFQEEVKLQLHPVTIVLLVILAILIIALIVLYILGRKAQKKQEEQQAAIDAAKQNVTMLIIDKKRMKLKDAGLPDIVVQQTPKLLRGSKVPIVKGKVGPQIMSFICDDKIFDSIPVKKEVKATVSGLYITSVKGLRGNSISSEPPKKKSKFAQWKEELQKKAGAKPL